MLALLALGGQQTRWLPLRPVSHAAHRTRAQDRGTAASHSRTERRFVTVGSMASQAHRGQSVPVRSEQTKVERGWRVDERTGRVRSADGSVVGFEVVGSGRPLVAIHGGTADRTRWYPVRDQLAQLFAVYLVDRRGRGLSTQEADGDYRIEREGEDIAAVLEAVGEPGLVVGHSFGGLVALEAALLSELVAGLVLYEPAAATPGNVPVEDVVLDRFDDLLREGRAEDALVLFFTDVVGVTRDAVEAMRGSPIWEARLTVLHTSVREGRAANGYSLDPGRFKSVSVPVKILLGTESPRWLRAAAEAAHTSLPGSALVHLEGQGHMAIDEAPERIVAEIVQAAEAVQAS